MTRIILAAVFVALGAPLLAGCAAPQDAQGGAAYAPYDQDTNPVCGALGNCAPLNNAPYPMRPGYSW